MHKNITIFYPCTAQKFGSFATPNALYKREIVLYNISTLVEMRRPIAPPGGASARIFILIYTRTYVL